MYELKDYLAIYLHTVTQVNYPFNLLRGLINYLIDHFLAESDKVLWLKSAIIDLFKVLHNNSGRYEYQFNQSLIVRTFFMM